jgi:hypothetical protein
MISDVAEFAKSELARSTEYGGHCDGRVEMKLPGKKNRRREEVEINPSG